MVSEFLKDGGVKSSIIRKYLPVMNDLINKYLQKLEFYVNFNLDDMFNETIKSRFRDEFSYASFSEGEKMRIDLALLFTWREIAKLKNSVNTNILILDEIFDSSLDNNGTQDFMKILYNITDGNNVFVISHKGEQIVDKFDNVIEFTKYKNFLNPNSTMAQLPNWQHHSKKQQKRTLKPQALRQARKRRGQLLKCLLTLPSGGFLIIMVIY
ncbi:MAG: hypothetical protein CM15mV5_1970 [uncultured marine virus]|nr:MAG: hypothetical protein CM15mV5_1970 [uncultured marine virus]